MSTVKGTNPTLSIELNPDNSPGVFTTILTLKSTLNIGPSNDLPFIKPIITDHIFTTNYTSNHFNKRILKALTRYLLPYNPGSDRTKRLRKKKYMYYYTDEVSAKVASRRATGKAW